MSRRPGGPVSLARQPGQTYVALGTFGLATRTGWGGIQRAGPGMAPALQVRMDHLQLIFRPEPTWTPTTTPRVFWGACAKG